MTAAYLVLSAALLANAATEIEGRPLSVGVLPIAGEATAQERGRFLEALVGALRGIGGLSVLSLGEPEALLGAEAAARLRSCPDDQCLHAEVAPVHVERLVAAELSPSNGGLTLQLRLIDTSSASARVLVRIKEDLPASDDPSVRFRIRWMAEELFSERVGEAAGALHVTSDPSGAQVLADGEALGRAPLGPISMRPGEHEILVRSPGHAPHSERIAIEPGRVENIHAELERYRSDWPWALGIAAIGASAAGGAFGLAAERLAGRWRDACESGSCEPSFTRESYDADATTLSITRTAANALLGAAVVLGAAAIVTYFFDPGLDGAEVTP